MVTDAGDVAAVLARSDERDRYEQRIRAAWRDGYASGREHGWRVGYDQALADEAEWWDGTRRLLVAAVRPVLNPAGDRADADLRVRAAEAACRRDAAAHEREFVARAYATPSYLRNDVQRATVASYPPPRRSTAA